MFYEEKTINGVLHYRTHPDAEFEPFSMERLSAEVDDLRSQLRERNYRIEAARDALGRESER